MKQTNLSSIYPVTKNLANPSHLNLDTTDSYGNGPSHKAADPKKNMKTAGDSTAAKKLTIDVSGKKGKR